MVVMIAKGVVRKKREWNKENRKTAVNLIAVFILTTFGKSNKESCQKKKKGFTPAS
jgi:hypothetical protein